MVSFTISILAVSSMTFGCFSAGIFGKIDDMFIVEPIVIPDLEAPDACPPAFPTFFRASDSALSV